MHDDDDAYAVQARRKFISDMASVLNKVIVLILLLSLSICHIVYFQHYTPFPASIMLLPFTIHYERKCEF